MNFSTLLNLSAKKTFQDLRSKSPIFCKALGENVRISRVFYNHISSKTKSRTKEEISERLVIIPLIEKVFQNGKQSETRKKNGETFFQITHSFKAFIISIILVRRKNNQLYLVSCFRNNRKEPVLTFNGSSRTKRPGSFRKNSTFQNLKSQKNFDLKKLFTTFLKSQDLENKPLLLAVSGGVDSRVLLDVACANVDMKLINVLHINHQTRPECGEEQAFVENLCKKKNVQCAVEKISGKPNETSWRKARRVLFQKYVEKTGADRTITAHHATDLVETMIFRMTKGTGPSGLSPFDISTKPFWQVPKSAIVEYAQTHKLEWMEDDSNQDLNFERNLIRHEVLPTLRKITPNLEKVFVTESKIFGDISHFLHDELQHHAQLDPESNSIPLTKFLSLPDILQGEFLRLMAEKTPSSDEVRDGFKWLKNKPKGGSEKTIGGTEWSFKNGELYW